MPSLPYARWFGFTVIDRARRAHRSAINCVIEPKLNSDVGWLSVVVERHAGLGVSIREPSYRHEAAGESCDDGASLHTRHATVGSSARLMPAKTAWLCARTRMKSNAGRESFWELAPPRKTT